MLSIFVGWLLTSVGAILGLYITLHPPSKKWIIRACWSVTLALVFFSLPITIHQHLDQENEKMWNEESLQGKQREALRSQRSSLDQLRERIAAQVEINTDIEYLSAVLVFSEPVLATAAVNEKSFIRITKTNKRDDHTLATFTYVSNGEFGGKPTWGFQFISRTSIHTDSKTPGGLTVATGTLSTLLTELPIPLFVGGAGATPFKLIRDLREAEVGVFLSEALSKKVVRIDIIANSKRHFTRRLVIFSAPINATEWEESEIYPGPFIKGPVKLWRPKRTYQQMLIYPEEKAIWVNSDMMPEMVRMAYDQRKELTY